MLPILAGLATSLCWGLADFAAGVQSRRLPVVVVLVISQTGGLLVIAVVLAFTGGGIGSSQALLAALAGGGSIFALGAFYRALAIGTMSVVAPIAATGAAVPVVAGLLGGDRPGLLPVAGIVLALVGVLLAAREPDRELSDQSASNRRAIVLAGFAATGFGIYLTLIHSAAGDGGELMAVAISRAAGVVALFGLVGATRTSVAAAPVDVMKLCAIGTLDLSAGLLYAYASTHGLLSVIAVLASLYPVVPVVLGRTLLNERLNRTQAAGVGAALAGVLLIASNG